MKKKIKEFELKPNDTKITFAKVVLKSGEEAIVALEDSAARTYAYMNLPYYNAINETAALKNGKDVHFWEAGIYTLDQLKKCKKFVKK